MCILFRGWGLKMKKKIKVSPSLIFLWFNPCNCCIYEDQYVNNQIEQKC